MTFADLKDKVLEHLGLYILGVVGLLAGAGALAWGDARWLPQLAFNDYVKQSTLVQLKGDRRDIERRISDLEIQAKYEADPVKRAILEERIEQAKSELESVTEDLEAAQ